MDEATKIEMPLGAIVALTVAGALAVAACFGYFAVRLSRRRRVDGQPGDATVDHDREALTAARSWRLRRCGRRAAEPDDAPIPYHRSLPILPRVLTRCFARSPSGNWPSGFPRSKNASWIDEDALHGPEVRTQRTHSRRNRIRESWPLGDVAPTLPRIYNTIHGTSYEDQQEQERILGNNHVRSPYGQLRVFTGPLPKPPPPVHVGNNGRQLVRNGAGMPYSPGSQDPQRQKTGPIASQARSLPVTPSGTRGRNLSTDSTLTEILRSTEKRLQEGAVSRKNTLSRSPNKTVGTSKECLVESSESVRASPALSRPVSQPPRTPSPKKATPRQSVVSGHKREESIGSLTSDTDSLFLDELLQEPLDSPSGLTSPSRNPRSQQPERQAQAAQSVRSSISSTLSTVYSEDERPEGANSAKVSPNGAVAQPAKAKTASHAEPSDPFASSSNVSSATASELPARPPSNSGWRRPTNEEILQDSRQRAWWIRGLPTRNCQSVTLPPEIKLPPNPVIPGRKPKSFSQLGWYDYPGGGQRVSITFHSQGAARQSSPKKSSIPTKNSQYPLILGTPAASRLSSIVIAPPISSGLTGLGIFAPEPPEPASTPGTAAEQQKRHTRAPSLSPVKGTALSTPPSLGRTATATASREPTHSPPQSPQQQQQLRASSESSSVYSQDLNNALSAAAQNSASFQANSRLGAASPSPSPRPTPDRVLKRSTERISSTLAATVGDLRRMNSSASTATTVSVASGGSPTLPALRGGGFSPAQQRSGRGNYLALGNTSLRDSAGPRASVTGSPCRKTATAEGRQRSLLRLAVDAGEDEDGAVEKENRTEGEGRQKKTKTAEFKMPTVDFTLEYAQARAASSSPAVTRTSASIGPAATEGGLREGSGGNVATPVSKRRRRESGASAWGSAGPDGSPRCRKRGSQDSLGLYDSDGFLIPTPLKKGPLSPRLRTR
ncbi:hypothetical protein B0H67DRAFT_169891 [Lasiosphaeris hirsuta]|uniref:Uncharacterized protein n=1 Tax=Lasiosphaeris hirsuta TaxID=260670 RepID=A0AA40E269_9PEZI|nr:hypothetical protein B0H67DRAFT_169891 [Lasiosphaeris hirsuta]